MDLNSTVSSSWSPPPISELNFSDCTAASTFYADYLISYTDEMFDVGYSATFNFLRSLVPLNWTQVELTDGDLLLWHQSWDESTRDDILNTAADTAVHGCKREMCGFLPLEGDPDLAGIGMMASYYLIALLTTFYTIVISLNSIITLETYKHWKRFHGWFEQTLNTFLDASLLSSASMLLASIYRFSSAVRDPENGDNAFFYSLVNAVTVSMFSIFPPLTLQLTARRLRRRGIRSILWFLVIAFVITMTVLYYRWRGPGGISGFFENDTYLSTQATRHVQQIMWLLFCDLTSHRLVKALDYSIITAQVLLSLNLPGWIYLVYTIGKVKKEACDTPQGHNNDNLHHHAPKGWERYGKKARALNIVLCCAMMWLLLGTFTAIAVRLADAMGPWAKDRRWSIGQVLALATFVPLIIDIIAIALEEPRAALEGKLPKRFRLVEAREAAEATDMKTSRRFAFTKSLGRAEYEMVDVS
ncbi:hypothetical protein INS49_014153 [Diaporthe citri]|uniref:uncharacterized protein n=1 Tax=Diaporthe citri TaxID=83186 RepID=UPI001C804939|nr:uncharacterized protein INS49_014153 [Diaporthe citri]KAG6358269.1 hypothetical protein INS49_014153 [Diaporthe citri]